MDKNELVNKIRGIEGLTNDEKSALIEMLRAYSGGYPFSISGDIRSVPS